MLSLQLLFVIKYSSYKNTVYLFSCLLIDLHCTHPDIIPNAQYDVSSLAPGGTVTYTCDPTYTHMYGDLVRLCNGGVWRGILPTCSSMYSVGFFFTELYCCLVQVLAILFMKMLACMLYFHGNIVYYFHLMFFGNIQDT